MILPENLLRRMRPEDRQKLGRGGMTAAEAEAAFVAKNEGELQILIKTMLNRRCIPDKINGDLAAVKELRSKLGAATKTLSECPLLFTTTCNVAEKAWIAKARDLICPNEPCDHREQDHGICMDCGEDRDMNSDRFGKKPNEP